MDVNGTLGSCAAMAAFMTIGEEGAAMRLSETMGFDPLDREPLGRMVGFVRQAGDVPGESLYRWSAAQGLHVFPANGFAGLAPEIRLWFESFTAVVKALAPILDPPQAQEKRLSPVQNRVRVEDTIFRRYPSPGARTHAGLDPSQPTSTADVHVTPMKARGWPPVAEGDPGAPLPSGGAMFDPRPGPTPPEAPLPPGPPAATAAPGKVIHGGALDALGPNPTVEDLLEARRAEFRARDPGDVGHVVAAPPERAPAGEAFEQRTVAAETGDGRVEGVVAVGKVADRY
ncbi:MAG: hypothetical protein ACR650_09720 [Methylocystis sp.]